MLSRLSTIFLDKFNITDAQIVFATKGIEYLRKHNPGLTPAAVIDLGNVFNVKVPDLIVSAILDTESGQIKKEALDILESALHAKLDRLNNAPISILHRCDGCYKSFTVLKTQLGFSNTTCPHCGHINDIV